MSAEHPAATTLIVMGDGSRHVWVTDPPEVVARALAAGGFVPFKVMSGSGRVWVNAAHVRELGEREATTMNLAEKAITSARAAKFTAEVREKVAAAMDAPEGEREPLLTDALAAAIEALDALTELLIAAREEAGEKFDQAVGRG
jgi:hypothetical protein